MVYDILNIRTSCTLQSSSEQLLKIPERNLKSAGEPRLFHRSICLEFPACQSVHSPHRVQNSAQNFTISRGLSRDVGPPCCVNRSCAQACLCVNVCTSTKNFYSMKRFVLNESDAHLSLFHAFVFSLSSVASFILLKVLPLCVAEVRKLSRLFEVVLKHWLLGCHLSSCDLFTMCFAT